MMRPFDKRTDGEAGTSLIEVTMVVAILSLVLTLFLQSLASSQNATSGVQQRHKNLDEARVLMARASRDVRTAVRLQAGTSSFTIASATEIKFYGFLRDADKPQLIRLYLDNKSQLIEEVSPPTAASVCPTWAYPATPGAVRFVGQYLVRDNNDPIFRFYDKNGAELKNTPLNATDLLGIDSVGLTFSVRASTKLTVASTTLQTKVAPPNLDYTKGC
jgi:type II secretory pathway pseudopilin PulG